MKNKTIDTVQLEKDVRNLVVKMLTIGHEIAAKLEPGEKEVQAESSVEIVNIDFTLVPIDFFFKPSVQEAITKEIIKTLERSSVTIPGVEYIKQESLIKEELADGETKNIHEEKSNSSNRRARQKSNTNSKTKKIATRSSGKGASRLPIKVNSEKTEEKE